MDRITKCFEDNLLSREYQKNWLKKLLTIIDNQICFSVIALIRPSAFQDTLKGNYQLWNEVLLPASERGLVTGEVFKGSLVNVNSIDDLEKLDAYLTEE